MYVCACLSIYNGYCTLFACMCAVLHSLTKCIHVLSVWSLQNTVYMDFCMNVHSCIYICTCTYMYLHMYFVYVHACVIHVGSRTILSEANIERV